MRNNKDKKVMRYKKEMENKRKRLKILEKRTREVKKNKK